MSEMLQQQSTIDSLAEWQALRRAPDPQEADLRNRTFKWLATLPVELRPMNTARQYPRIVNKIGDLWGHCEYTRLHFQSLLIERRKGRKGFPVVVKEELIELQRYYFEHFSGLPAIIWNAVPIKPRKIPNEIFPMRVETEIEIQALSA